MALVNEHFLKLPNNYFFSDIEKKVNLFRVTHPKADIIRLGTGDVTLPLPPACIEAMHKAPDDFEKIDFIHGYGLKNVKDSAEACGGFCVINHENDIYSATVIIPVLNP